MDVNPRPPLTDTKTHAPVADAIPAPPEDIPAPEAAETNADAARAAALVINHFARTLKTCRLYDASNPTVVRFRAELAATMRRVLDEYPELTLRFTSDDVLYGDVSLYPAKSRDDNLALPFYRDGIRAITLKRGLEAREVAALLEAVLKVTGQSAGEDDLVTLLWEAHLPHADLDYVPADSDAGTSDGAATQDDQGVILPWPTSEEAEAPPPAEGAAAVVNPAGTRADDWTTGEETVEIEAGFEELNSLAPSEVRRFNAEYQAEHAVANVTAMIAIARAYLCAGANDDDRSEFGRFLPRVTRQAVANGMWLEAQEALKLIESCGTVDWSAQTFTQELLQPVSISTTVQKLDRQDEATVKEFIELARNLGDPGVDWLNLVLAESEDRRNRRLFAEAIAGLCRTNPERLAPWLSDPRWFVVRNCVHILGWIGGDQIVGLLQGVVRHPDARVRQEVAAALGQADLRLARPLLLRMLEGADTRMFCSVLHQLSGARDVAMARMLMSFMQSESFDERPIEEKRAIYSALSAVAQDEVVPDLEEDLHRGNWFARDHEAHRQSVARVLARIGTPLARMVLERGAQSKRAPIRKACEDALAGMGHHD